MNILITSVGRRSYMLEYFKKELSKIGGRVYALNSERTYALTLADAYEISPSIYESGYIDFVLSFSKRNNVSAVISLFDIDLPILSKHKKLFKENKICLVLSDWEFVSMCNDKWKTYQYLTSNGFLTPKTYSSLAAFNEDRKNNQITFPVIVKPRWGMGSIGVQKACNENELNFYYYKVLDTIKNSYLNLESRVDFDSAVIIQEYLEGDEFGIDVFNDFSGKNLAVVPKKKIAMRAGETDIAQVVNNKKLLELGTRLSHITRHIANLDVDCFEQKGEFYVLEMNARFGGQYPFSHASGVNFPKVIVDLLLGNPVDINDITFKEVLASKDIQIRTYE